MVKVRLTESFTGMRQFEAAHPKMPSVAEELPRRAFLPTGAAYPAAGNREKILDMHLIPGWPVDQVHPEVEKHHRSPWHGQDHLAEVLALGDGRPA